MPDYALASRVIPGKFGKLHASGIFSSYSWKESVFPKMSNYSVNVFYELAQILITYQIHAFHKSDNDALIATTSEWRKFVSDLSTNWSGEQLNHKVSGPQRGVSTESHMLTHTLEASSVSQHAAAVLPTLLLSQTFLEHSAFFFFSRLLHTTIFFLNSLNSLIIIPCYHLLHTEQNLPSSFLHTIKYFWVFFKAG